MIPVLKKLGKYDQNSFCLNVALISSNLIESFMCSLGPGAVQSFENIIQQITHDTMTFCS